MELFSWGLGGKKNRSADLYTLENWQKTNLGMTFYHSHQNWVREAYRAVLTGNTRVMQIPYIIFIYFQKWDIF